MNLRPDGEAYIDPYVCVSNMKTRTVKIGGDRKGRGGRKKREKKKEGRRGERIRHSEDDE